MIRRAAVLTLTWLLQLMAFGYYQHYPLRDHFHVIIPGPPRDGRRRRYAQGELEGRLRGLTDAYRLLTGVPTRHAELLAEEAWGGRERPPAGQG